ncbi:Methylated-DNA--protein-cysteine methyltransferase [Pelagimonas phthalicica]|uniref:Methylated-DNA--protein-cysteine methyltransferase n=1 Tax=Pelagimonas phthalicica TaxID=1037362 RepID=A0A238JIP8_9RHOB|nr:methylated-DNA--[protein]-cysteine S-methyltransferase [Pelagimonas phthalicica]TDS90095.1 methylated-DNA-[protein]-cysteine S-methyltransferase [Pelagimonas phthalicica]SMX30263.1 Methylated-DNA--protein-cysteine methyltransferase [Pelagimonas phthalicica]
MAQIYFDTPTGVFSVTQEGDAIVRAGWNSVQAIESTPLLEEAKAQILAYFAGELEVFDLALKVNGSDFQRQVCEVMSAIPFGETRTYGEIAQEIGAPAQAVGGACGGNPIPLIIPCHRVLSASGLGGFSGTYGVETKVELLKHEGAASLLI